MSAILELKKRLQEVHIPFEYLDLFDGHQICYPNYQNCLCSVIQHRFSYGNKLDLLEINGLLTEEESECDSVVGHLTVENVFKRIETHFKATRVK